MAHEASNWRRNAGMLAFLAAVASVFFEAAAQGQSGALRTAFGFAFALALTAAAFLAFVAFARALKSVVSKLKGDRARGRPAAIRPLDLVAASLTVFALLPLAVDLATQARGQNQAVRAHARDRVMLGVAVVEEFHVARGRWPTAEEFRQAWVAARSSNPAANVWVEDTVTKEPSGVFTAPDVGARFATPDDALRAADTGGVRPDFAKSGELIFLRVLPGPQRTWYALRDGATGKAVAVRHYAVGIFGADGEPWWAIAGGR